MSLLSNDLCSMAPIDVLQSVTKELLVADPLTPLKELRETSAKCMRSRMELNSVYFASVICKKLEAMEKGKKVAVDRCEIKQGVGDISCSLQDGKRMTEAKFLFCIENRFRIVV